MGKKEKNWMTLNGHGKDALQNYIFAFSTNDVKTSELDYIHRKGLVDYSINFKDANKRHERAYHCLTDIGINTAIHYFKHFKNHLP